MLTHPNISETEHPPIAESVARLEREFLVILLIPAAAVMLGLAVGVMLAASGLDRAAGGLRSLFGRHSGV